MSTDDKARRGNTGILAALGLMATALVALFILRSQETSPGADSAFLASPLHQPARFTWSYLVTLADQTLLAKVEEMEWTQGAEPWVCAYYKNLDFSGPIAGFSTTAFLASEWETRSWTYSGVPELGNHMDDFSMRCVTNRAFGAQNGVADSYIFKASKWSYTFRALLDGQQLPLAHDPFSSHCDKSWFAWCRFAINVRSDAMLLAGRHEVVVEFSKNEEITRPTLLFSWNKVGRSVRSAAEKVAALTSSAAWMPVPQAHEKYTSLGESWWVNPAWLPSAGCLVYSVGIRDLFQTEESLAKLGCEVHLFDCTVSYDSSEKFIFHEWCLGEEGQDASSFLLDGAIAAKGNQQKEFKFVTFREAVKRLGHENRQLTILKMDCEGCEWTALPDFQRTLPSFFNTIQVFILELHYAHDFDKGPASGVSAANGAAVHDLVTATDLQCYSFATNSDMSTRRRQISPVALEIVQAGAFDSACCYEIMLVRDATLSLDPEAQQHAQEADPFLRLKRAQMWPLPPPLDPEADARG